ncbi:MAG: ribbon-helix-helix protein, CopG family [Acidobacteria bacterium]|nr:ribbon-helix-helix protein, CopG family [Acidobacteriota bacterium]
MNKQKTSVTLSADILAGLRRAARRGESRSETVERLLRERLNDEASRLRRAREMEQINRHADALNAEAADVLAYQGDL